MRLVWYVLCKCPFRFASFFRPAPSSNPRLLHRPSDQEAARPIPEEQEKIIKKLVPVLILVALVAAAIGWREELARLLPGRADVPAASPSESSAPLVKVTTQPVQLQGNDRVFEAVGTGRARLSIEVYPGVSDEVTEVRFKAEDKVEKGDVLVQLDDREERLAVRLAEVELKDARSLLDRYERAVQRGGVPQSEVDAARADFDSAEVALEQAQLDLAEHQIKAPFTGHVGLSDIDPGDRVNPDTRITSLDDRGILHVDFEIPEALSGALVEEANQTVTATTPAYPDRTFSGRVTTRESRVDPERRTLRVRADIENPDDLLRPGMSFTTRWEIEGKKYPAVPGISLQWGREGSYVWIVRDGVAKKVAVRVVARTGGQVLLEADLEEGDAVVVEGVQRLRDGLEVEVLGRPDEPAPEVNVEDRMETDTE